MWDLVFKISITVGAVWVIAALSAKAARKDEALKQAQHEEKESEKVDEVIRANANRGRDELLDRLHDREKGQ